MKARFTFVALALGATLANTPAAEPEFHASAAEAIEQAHTRLWSGFVDEHGILLDYIGDLPTPEDCTLGKPNAIGWWSPIENGPMFTGLYLPALCERARRTGDPIDRQNAQRLARGLIRCASVSTVPGFIARGVGSDGQCHYPLGSDDQTHPWFYGLHAYLRSGIPSPEEKTSILAKMKSVAEVLESTGWNCPCDGAFTGQFRGGFSGHLFRDAVRYLFILRAMQDLTGDEVWRERYQKALAVHPEGSEHSRAQICAAGYGPDRQTIPTIEIHNLWIYVGSQGSLAQLLAMETDPQLRSQFQAGLALNAQNVAPSLETYRKFDNQDSQLFGHTHWRNGYTTWFAQPTQAEALKLAQTGDKAKLGGRKHYEAQSVKHPLSAAAITALSGTPNPLIFQIVRHYDYSKLFMSEFFLAECAYYALPVEPANRP